jgi:hypothetical protein
MSSYTSRTREPLQLIPGLRAASLAFILFASSVGCPVFGEKNAVEIRVPNSIEKGALKKGVAADADSFMHVFQITTASDGIISRINIPSNADLQNPFDIKISRQGVQVTIERYGGRSVDTIHWTNGNLTVVGPHFTRKSKTPMGVSINKSKSVIYESSELILRSDLKGGPQESFKKKPSDFSAFRLEERTLFVDYQRQGNVDFKIVFEKRPEELLATYYYPVGENDYLEYSPPIQIRGNSLHFPDTRINVINYFILRAADELLAAVMFPSLFAG